MGNARRCPEEIALGWWTRNRLIGVGAAAAVLVAAGVFLVISLDDYGEVIEGPTGTYPDAIGSGAPAAPSEVVALASGPRIVDGLGVELADSDPDDFESLDTVAAFDLRTGEEYWSYRRAESTPSAFAVADGLVYVLWDDDLLVQFDPRTAEPLWHTEIDDLGSDRRLVAVDGVMAVLTHSRVVGVHIADGAEAWTVMLPDECRLDRSLAVGDSVAVETSCERETRHHVRLFDGDGELAVLPGSPTVDLVRAGEGRFAVTDLYSDALVYSADSGEQVDAVPLPSEDFSYYRDGDDERLIAEDFHASQHGGPLYAAWGFAEEAPIWTVESDDAWSDEARPWLVEGRLYALRREASEGRLWELVVYDAATGEELAATEIDLDEYITVPEHDENFRYNYDVFMRIWDIGSGTVTVTIENGAGLVSHSLCEQCSIVFTDPA